MGYKTRSNYKTGWGEEKIKVMSNADRRRLGIEQDETLPDYQPQKCKCGNKSTKTWLEQPICDKCVGNMMNEAHERQK